MSLSAFIRYENVPWNWINDPLFTYAAELYDEALDHEQDGNHARARCLRYLGDRVVLA